MRKKALIALMAVCALAVPLAGCGGDDDDDGGGGGDNAFLQSYDKAFEPLTAKQPQLADAIKNAPTQDGKAIADAFTPIKPAIEDTSAALAKLKPPSGAADELRVLQGSVGDVGESVDAAIAAGEAGKTKEARAGAAEVGKAVQPFIKANAELREAAQ